MKNNNREPSSASRCEMRGCKRLAVHWVGVGKGGRLREVEPAVRPWKLCHSCAHVIYTRRLYRANGLPSWTTGIDADEYEGRDLSMVDEPLLGDDALRSLLGEALSRRQCDVVVRRYGLFGKRKQTQAEVGRSLRITRQCVLLAERRVLQKLAFAFARRRRVLREIFDDLRPSEQPAFLQRLEQVGAQAVAAWLVDACDDRQPVAPRRR